MKAQIPKFSVALGINEAGIARIEETKNAVFIGDFCLRDREDKYWTDEPVAIFYNEKPAKPEYSSYFGLLYKGNTLYITAGESAFKDPINGFIDTDGSFIYSRFRHDYRVSWDESKMIDGGRDYLRCNNVSDIVSAKIDGDHLEIEE